MEVALLILDGWGISRYPPALRGEDASGPGRDAIAAATRPTFDHLIETGAIGRLDTSGRSVGLPAGHMGNSAVGHLTIGAGRVIDQPYTRINDTIAADRLGDIPALGNLIEHCSSRDSRLHLWGLASDGGVHAALDHLTACINLAGEESVDAVTHIVTDGRDTPPRSARRFIPSIERAIDRAGTGDIATVCGRYFAMDRDEHWQRTRRAVEAMVNGTATRVEPSATEAITSAYEVGESDEFIAPTRIDGGAHIRDGDGVLLVNFRADRARQLTRMLTGIAPPSSGAFDPPNVELVTMTEYDETFDIPVCFEPIEPDDTLGAAVSDAGLTQLRIAESEKYPHVTYFLNGGREVRYPGEIREIVPSPAVATYDRKPEMSAAAVTDAAIDIIGREDPDLLVLNYANPDMVGHTGDFDAAVAAVEAVDTELGRLLDALEGVHVLVIADHGNVENMGTADEPHTAHTTNPVPAIYRSPTGDDGNQTIRDGGTLADVTPTILTLLDIPIPDGMTGRTLLE